MPYETRCKTGRTGAKVCAMKSHWNFSQQKHSIDPTGPSCFGEFRTIWVHLEPFRSLTKLGAKRDEPVQKFVHEVASEFFTTKALNPPHWTLNSCFGEFHTIWVHLGPFGCLTELGAKRAELVQKFVPGSCIGIFRNECTRSTPLDPKLMFS